MYSSIMLDFHFSGLVICALLQMLLCQTLNDKMEAAFGRADLICPDVCQYTSQHAYFDSDMECCSCLALPFWINSTNMIQLNLGFVNSTIPVIMQNLQSENNSVSFLISQFGNLSIFPVNSCNITTLVYMDLSYNNISDLSPVVCAVRLDTLIVKGNRIEYLAHEIFHAMKHLRKLDLSFNKIRYIEPGFTFNMDGSLFFIDISFNNLTTIDITNLLWGKQINFCVANYSHNLIELISNEQDWQVTSFPYIGRGGFNDLTYNKFKYFIDFPYIGFADVTMLGLLYDYSFDFRFNEWICDCRFYPFLKAADLLENIYQLTDHLYVTCSSPPEFKNKLVRSFINNQNLLICNISLAEKCPARCHCFYQPGQTRTVVNCRSALSSRKLPSVLPDSRNLDVDFSENIISNLDKEFTRLINRQNTSYIKQIKKINLSKNNIFEISDFVLLALRNVTFINLTGNFLKNIPAALKIFHPCDISLGKVTIDCKCSDKWLKTWIPPVTSTCFNHTQVFCYTDSGNKQINDIGLGELGCDTESDIPKWITITFAVLLFISVFLSIMFYNFYVELYIVLRTFFSSHKHSQTELYMYDIYISCNEDDEVLRDWLSTCVVPFLKRNGLRIFLPYRDCEFGSSREEEIINIISQTKNVFIILSDKYPEELKTWISHEWKYAWIHYKQDWRKNIVIINYDMLNGSDIDNRYIKAFVRLGKYIAFHNSENNFYRLLISIIGRPLAKYKQEFTNRKVRFRSSRLVSRLRKLE